MLENIQYIAEMKKPLFSIVLCLLPGGPLLAKSPHPGVVIAHRASCGYLPEHTLQGVAMAHAFGSDFIEPDVVLTKDGVPVVLHDIQLDDTTDASTAFPEKKRADGRWYAIDFTLAEIKSLRVHERTDLKTGVAVYPKRFPRDAGAFQVPTLEEEIQLVQGLNKSTGRTVGLYPELKAPAFHTAAGQDIAKITVDMLTRYGYDSASAPLYLQSFDPKALHYVHDQLKSPLRLVQLIAENEWKEGDTDFKPMLTEAGLKEIAQYASGIGPWLPHVLTADPQHPGQVMATKLVGWAHAQKLVVHPYTVRADDLPKGIPSFEALLHLLFDTAKVDGIFTDFPDRALRFLGR